MWLFEVLWGKTLLSFPKAHLGLQKQILRFAQYRKQLNVSYTPQYLKVPIKSKICLYVSPSPF